MGDWRLMDAIWSQKDITPHRREFLSGLAQFYNRTTGICNPTQVTLARKLMCSPRTVIRRAAEAERCGDIVVVPQHTPDGRRIPNLYLFPWYDGVVPTVRHVPPVAHGRKNPERCTLTRGNATKMSEKPCDTVGTQTEETEGATYVAPTAPDRLFDLPSSVRSSRPAVPRPVRQPDDIRDAIVRVTRMQPSALTRSEWADLAKSVRELREVGATPAQIDAAAVEWSRRCPRLVLTHRCLRRDWASLQETPQKRADDASNEQYRREAEWSRRESARRKLRREDPDAYFAMVAAEQDEAERYRVEWQAKHPNGVS